jgi:hypothetical protein
MSRVAIDGSREGDRIRVLRSRVTELLGDAGERALTRVLNMLEAPRGEDVSLA